MVDSDIYLPMFRKLYVRIKFGMSTSFEAEHNKFGLILQHLTGGLEPEVKRGDELFTRISPFRPPRTEFRL